VNIREKLGKAGLRYQTGSGKEDKRVGFGRGKGGVSVRLWERAGRK